MRAAGSCTTSVELPAGETVLTWNRREVGARAGVYFVVARSIGYEVRTGMILID
jgi:hypothetical protein